MTAAEAHNGKEWFMSYARTDGETYAWLQPVGTHADPFDANWHWGRGSEVLRSVWSTKYPASWRVGDRIAYYASHWGKVIAIVEMTDAPQDDNAGRPGRWRWCVPVCPLLVVGMEAAPTATELELAPPHDYHLLSAAHYARVRDALAASVARLGASERGQLQ